jgi:rhomboid protease GluP
MALMYVCGALYVLSVALAPQAVVQPAGLFDIGSPDGRVLLSLGMSGGPQWWTRPWTLLTANLLHGSLLHVGFNIYWLRLLGWEVTGRLGPARTILAFFVTGIAGFLLSNVVSGAYTLGASAGAFGLLGLLIGFGKRRGGHMGDALKGRYLYLGGILLLFGFMMPNTNNLAHIGGGLAGVALAYVFPDHEGKREKGFEQVLAVLLSLGAAGGIVVSLVLVGRHLL